MVDNLNSTLRCRVPLALKARLLRLAERKFKSPSELVREAVVRATDKFNQGKGK